VNHAAALETFLNDPASAGWRGLPFFATGAAARLALELDRRAMAGAAILPVPHQVYAALALTPLDAVKVVILGQDPYPTPGAAHGLAFSHVGAGPLPASLRRIYAELSADLATPAPSSGDLTGWARQGVLLLNSALTVEAGKAGAHLGLGWAALTDQVIARASAACPAAAFILWGDKARAKQALIDPRHEVIGSAHPSPLAARGDFLGSRPFSRANAYLTRNGMAPVRWA
jgi:uracil-DNA glycosylase